MNVRRVLHLISYMVLFIAVAIGMSAGVSFLYLDPPGIARQLLDSSLVVLLLGALINRLTVGRIELSRKDGFGIVALGWVVVSLVGALPYLLTGAISHPIDAVFETMSGFTTTGASIFTDVEVLPKGILFWRSLTQWMGGMGVLLLCVAILPFLGVGGMQIYRAEMPGPSKDRLTPRIANTAKLLYGVYVLLTLVQTLLLMAAGMGFFDAINHSFTTLSTGGFSTYNRSVAYFESDAITLIITLFMILGGTNFALHYRLLRGDWRAFGGSPEFKAYLAVIFGSTALIAWDVVTEGQLGIADALLHGIFQVVSLLTTTGFATLDYDLWPLASKTLLFLILFSGGCAGSTAGGVKVMRSLVMLKECQRQLRMFLQPQAVIKVRLGRQSVSAPVVSGIASFLICFLLIFIGFTLVMTLFMPDLESAASAVIACLGNVGPGFGAVGPTQNFAFIPGTGKVLLTFAMLLGRLELFTVLVLFSPAFWKR